MYEEGKLSHIVIWRSFSDEVHEEKDIKMGKLFSAKSLNSNTASYTDYVPPVFQRNALARFDRGDSTSKDFL